MTLYYPLMTLDKKLGIKVCLNILTFSSTILTQPVCITNQKNTSYIVK